MKEANALILTATREELIAYAKLHQKNAPSPWEHKIPHNPAKGTGSFNEYIQAIRGEKTPVIADLSEANLEKLDLCGIDLSSTILQEARLAGADLICTNFVNADLTKANLFGARLIRARLVNAKLGGANLRWADLRWANLSNAHLENAKLVRAKLTSIEAYFADFSGADLSHTNFVDFSGMDLSHTNFTQASFGGATLNGATFYKARISTVHMGNTDLTETDFSDADIENTDFSNAKMDSCIFITNGSPRFPLAQEQLNNIITDRKGVEAVTSLFPTIREWMRLGNTEQLPLPHDVIYLIAQTLAHSMGLSPAQSTALISHAQAMDNRLIHWQQALGTPITGRSIIRHVLAGNSVTGEKKEMPHVMLGSKEKEKEKEESPVTNSWVARTTGFEASSSHQAESSSSASNHQQAVERRRARLPSQEDISR